MAGAVAVVLAVIVLSGGGPGIDDVAAAAVRAPTAQVASVPPDSKLLQENVGGVAFPNYAAKFGWKPVGTRTDEIGGRKTRTVFYEKDGKRIAYTIVDGDPLSTPGDAATATREGTDLQWIETQGRTVVTWERRGPHLRALRGPARGPDQRSARARGLEGQGRGPLLAVVQDAALHAAGDGDDLAGDVPGERGLRAGTRPRRDVLGRRPCAAASWR